jgi:hypothetical protein
MNTRLLHDETIERYCTREVLIEERMYTTFFRYTGRMALDSHEVEVGFTLNSKTWNGTVYLPSVDDNGLMARNRSRWYPVYLVLPPPAFRNHPMLPSGTGFLDGLLNDAPAAVSLADFCPTFTAAMPIQQSRLYTELQPKESHDINDTRNWIALDLGSALIELFNHKIVRDIARSLRPGFAGPNATVRSLHALLRALPGTVSPTLSSTENCRCMRTPNSNIVGGSTPPTYGCAFPPPGDQDNRAPTRHSH